MSYPGPGPNPFGSEDEMWEAMARAALRTLQFLVFGLAFFLLLEVM